MKRIFFLPQFTGKTIRVVIDNFSKLVFVFEDNSWAVLESEMSNSGLHTISCYTTFEKNSSDIKDYLSARDLFDSTLINKEQFENLSKLERKLEKEQLLLKISKLQTDLRQLEAN